jgi:lipopolysaccharide transport system permease protein
MKIAVIFSFVRQDLLDRHAGSILGNLWVLLNPLFMVAIFATIFGRAMASTIPGAEHPLAYAIYLMAGVIPWTAFSNTIQRVTTIYTDKRHIIGKVGISLTLLPAHVLISEFITMSIGMVLLAALMAVLQLTPGVHLLALPGILLVQYLLALACGMILSVLHVFVRDIRELIQIILQIWFWMTPIVWVPAALPAQTVHWLALFNPMYAVTNAYHAMVLPFDAPNYTLLLAYAAVGAALFVAALWLINRAERHIRDLL